MLIENALNYKKDIVDLLESEQLPTIDLPSDLSNFFVMKYNDEVVGTGGLEIYDRYALLRSVAVSKQFRNKGIAERLICHLEDFARSKNLERIYLMTETAAGYFKRKDYQHIQREEVPPEIQASSEFSHVCPQSAMVMNKTLNKK